MATTTSSPNRQLALRPGIGITSSGPGSVTLSFHHRPVIRVSGITDSLATALEELEGSPVSPLLDDAALVAEFSELTATVRRCVLPAVRLGDEVIAVAESLRADVDRVTAQSLRADELVRLSKFAYAHRQEDELMIESPISGARVIAVDERVGALIAAIAHPTQASELTAHVADLPAPVVHDLLELLLGAGVIETTRADTPEAFASDTDPVLRQWDFHDLLFHSRSRFGRTTEPFGGVFPYVGQIEPEIAVRTPHDGPVVPLPAPDLDEILTRDPSLLLTMETRHSCRTFGDEPLTLDELGEFLFRTCRIKEVYGPQPGLPYQASRRPYPTGGAAYELEVYLTVSRVQGLPEGCYHYEADAHRLRLLPASENDRRDLLEAASLSAGGDVHPDVLFTFTSRFQRLQWKYRSIAYAVTLKHVGALYQTMYLVASAMKIGACGLGSGNSQTSVDAFGLDYLRESSVGEFILGSAPAASRSLPPASAVHAPLFPGEDWGLRAARLRA